MSLLHLVHRNIVIKFSETTHFKPEALYAFRLTGVDGMGFLQIQDLNPEHELTSEPYWVNKDLVREIHEVDLAKTTLPILFVGKTAEPAPTESSVEQPAREITPKPAKKTLPKTKSVLKNKPVLN